MAYTEKNIRRSAETFLQIRTIGGAECTNDIYARSPGKFEYWYIGKVARTDGTVKDINQAISRLWNMMEEHACRLRAVELGREFGNVELWVARGDSELEMSQALGSGSGSGDKMSLKKMERYAVGSEHVKALEVGFIAEVVNNDGKGFLIVRDDEGRVMQ